MSISVISLPIDCSYMFILSFAEIISTSTLPDSESVQMVSEGSTSASFFSVDSTLHTGPSTSATLPAEDIPLGSRPVQMDDLG